jgi:hypothetical protein
MQDSIIVYRNPVEKMIWENPLPIFCFGIVMFVTFCIVFFTCKFIHNKLMKNRYGKSRFNDMWILWVAFPVSILCGILALIYLPV